MDSGWINDSTTAIMLPTARDEAGRVVTDNQGKAVFTRWVIYYLDNQNVQQFSRRSTNKLLARLAADAAIDDGVGRVLANVYWTDGLTDQPLGQSTYRLRVTNNLSGSDPLTGEREVPAETAWLVGEGKCEDIMVAIVHIANGVAEQRARWGP